MHPAKSVIFFTTASGAGYGLIVWLGLLGASGLLSAGKEFYLTGIGLALILIVSGLLSSTLHLGHPERAWRALSQWRSSWLSREGVAAIFTFAPIVAYGYGQVFMETSAGFSMAMGLLSALASLATVYCTAMIYASLKAIPAWSNPWVPAGYVLLSLTSGGGLLVLLTAIWKTDFVEASAIIIAILLGASIALKLFYWRSIDTTPARSTAESATGLGAFGTVRLIEAPHSQSNYLLEEMGFVIARKHAGKLRKISLIIGFIIPGMIMTVIAIGVPAVQFFAAMACLFIGIGIVVERWLFFAEARHSVTLYYDASAV